MALTETKEIKDPKDVVVKTEESDAAEAKVAESVDMTKPADAALATPVTDSKAATTILPTMELVGDAAMFETQAKTGTDLAGADTRKGADLVVALPENKPNSVHLEADPVLLTPEALDASVNVVNSSLTNYLPIFGSPDSDALARTLGPMAQADRQALESQYQEKFGVSLRDDLKANLGDGEKFIALEAMLNRKDGESNLAGNARLALEVMESDPERGMRLLRSTLAPLNSTQSAEMQADYLKDYGQPLTSAINNIENDSVGGNQKEILNTLLTGADKLTSEQIVEMAKKAVQSQDLQTFAGVIGGDLPANIDARAALNADPAFVATMRDTFTSNENGQDSNSSEIADDYLREGRVSLSTILKADTASILPYFHNAENTDFVFSNATAKERRDYSVGKELVDSNREPANAQEQEAKRFYQFIEENIKTAASGTRQDVLRDELLHGGKTLISGLAELHKDSTLGLGLDGGHSTHDLMTRVENMNEQEWNLLKNPAYMASLKESLKSYASEDEQRQVLELIEAKLNAPRTDDGKGPQPFEQSLAVQRPLEQYIQNFTAAGADDTKSVADRIQNMSAADAERYKSDPAFKASVDGFVNNYLTDNQNGNLPGQLLARQLLDQTAETGKPPVLTELDKFVQERSNEMVSNEPITGDEAKKQLATIGKVEELMKDPALMERMQRVLAIQRGEQQGEVSLQDDLLFKTFKASLGGPTNFDYLLTDGKGQSYIGTKIALSGGVTGDWMVGKYPDLAKLPEEDRSRIRGYLEAPQQQVLDNVIAQGGNADLTDRLRSLALDGGNYKDFQEELGKLDPAAVEALKGDYTRKYGNQLDSDLFSSITAREGLTEAQQAVLKNEIAQNGQSQLEDRLRSMTLGGDVKYASFKEELSKLSPEQMEQLKLDYATKYQGDFNKDLFDGVTRNENLSVEQQKVLQNVINQNGQPQLVDNLRNFVIGDDKKFSDFQSELSNLTVAQKQELKSEYTRRYGGSLDNDFLAKVDSAHLGQYTNYMTSANLDGMQSFFDRMNRYAPLETADGTSLSQQRMLEVNEQVLKQFNANMEKMPPAVQEALAEYYSKTYQNNLDSNEKYAHFVADVTLTTASIAAAIALAGPTGGISLAALATREGAMRAGAIVLAGATTGAVARPAMIASMQNGTFDYSADNLIKQGLIGAVEGALIAPIGLGGKTAELTTRVLTKEAEEQAIQRTVAAQASEQLAEETAARVAAEKVAAEKLAAEKLAAEKLAAEKVAAENVAAETTETVSTSVAVKAEPVAVEQLAPEVIDTTVASEIAPEVFETALKAEPRLATETIPEVAVEVAPDIAREVTPELATKVATTPVKLEPAIPEVIERTVPDEILPVSGRIDMPMSAVSANTTSHTIAPEVYEAALKASDEGINAREIAAIGNTVDSTLVKPVIPAQVVEQVAEEVVERKVAATVVEQQVAEEVVERKVAATVVEQQVAEEVVERKVAATVVEQQVAEEVVERKVAATVVERETAEDIAAREAVEGSNGKIVPKTASTEVVERAATERAAAERLAAEKAAAERVAAERIAVERAAAERVAAERVAAERLAAEKLVQQEIKVAPLVAPVLARTVPAAVDAVVPEETETAVEKPPIKPSQELMDLAVVRRGEGPWQSAERILATDGKPHSVAEVRALTRAIQATFKTDNNGDGDMSGLKVKYTFITENNYEALVNAVQDEGVKNLLLNLAAQ